MEEPYHTELSDHFAFSVSNKEVFLLETASFEFKVGWISDEGIVEVLALVWL